MINRNRCVHGTEYCSPKVAFFKQNCIECIIMRHCECIAKRRINPGCYRLHMIRQIRVASVQLIHDNDMHNYAVTNL